MIDILGEGRAGAGPMPAVTGRCAEDPQAASIEIAAISNAARELNGAGLSILI
jgi:hypothetical protein